MKTRVEAGTDIAMIGAWDAARNDSTLAGAWGKNLDQVLEHDSAVGHLFVIRTGADGGGPIEVYVDAPVPDDVLNQCRVVNREFLLCLPTGRLVIGGVEDYRSGKAKTIGPDSVVEVPSGYYALRCYVPKGEAGFDPPARSELEKAIGIEDYRYYRRIQNLALVAYFGVPLIFVTLVFPVGWKKALFVAVVIGLIAYGLVRLISSTERFLRVSKAENSLWREAHQRGRPTFIFDLRRVNDVAGLAGGSVRLSET